MTANTPDLARTADALRQIAELEAVFGPHDDRIRTCLAASFWLIVERFGDDSRPGPADAARRHEPASREPALP